jgi:tripartite-type tricarboxylate transporter receptor subunit TctC
VTIRANRKSKAETKPIVSTTRRTQRRSVGVAMLYGHPSRVRATKLPRRQFLHLAARAAALSTLPRIARAQTYPARPVRIIVGFPAGGTTDLTARLTGQWLSERLGEPFIIENRPGAAANIATEAVVHAPADGYTLLLCNSSNASNATLYDKLNFNFIRDIAPVAGMISDPLVMAVNLSFPAKTVPEFIAHAKVNPGKVNMASAGNGSLTSATRSEVLPNIPTLGDSLPGYEASTWYGVGVPKKTPTEIVEKLNKEINAALADPKLKARFADLGLTVVPGSPADFGKLIADDTEKWAKVIKFAGIKPE